MGSFVNVVVYRLPAGMSVISPPSRCPICGARLSWRENFPILGWIFIRGRCRHCGEKVSVQYVLVELLMALLFAGLYAAYHMAGPSVPWWGGVGGEWWYRGHIRTIPMFVAHAILIAGLVAMTIIDARTFTIPIQVPVVITAVAFVTAPVQGFIQEAFPWRLPRGAADWPVAAADWQWFMTAAGGMAGIVGSILLLRMGVLRPSFADYEDYLPPPGPEVSEVPLGRREKLVALVSLATRLAGLVTGGVIGAGLPANGPQGAAQAFIGALLGYVVAGGLVLVVRSVARLILGTEALVHMGLMGPTVAADETDMPPGIADYPHARREMIVEIIFLLPCVAGMAAGWMVGAGLPHTGPPIAIQGLGGAMLGYLVGGGLIWLVRIVASLAFGREAMGAGDIHLLAAVGAVLGATVPVWVFFLAPFSGLLWIAESKGLGTVFRRARRELPYGPHLAVATLAVIACQPWIEWAQKTYLPFLPMPGLHP